MTTPKDLSECCGSDYQFARTNEGDGYFQCQNCFKHCTIAPPQETGGWEEFGDYFDSVFTSCCVDCPDRKFHKKQLYHYLREKIAEAKQEGRDGLLKELGLTQAWNMKEIRSIRDQALREVGEVIVSSPVFGVGPEENKLFDRLEKSYKLNSGWDIQEDQLAIGKHYETKVLSLLSKLQKK